MILNMLIETLSQVKSYNIKSDYYKIQNEWNIVKEISHTKLFIDERLNKMHGSN